MHILLILDKSDNPKDVEEYDCIVSAEIPNPVSNPRLHELVTTHMLHGPCGAFNKKCKCMVDGACKFKFPRDFLNETKQNADGYPEYMRRDSNTTFATKDGFSFDNRWVVPYNPYLLAKYECHINVEICTTVKAVKYLYKYGVCPLALWC